MKKQLLFAFLLVLIASCKNRETSPVTALRGEGDIQDSIERIIENTNVANAIYENSARAEFLKRNIQNDPTNIALHFHFAKELLNAGKTQQAIDHILELMNRYQEIKELNEQNKLFHELLGISYLRLAEQINCQQNHNGESCIVPITGEGIHKVKNGSEMAVKKYGEILQKFPDDDRSRWLYNVAQMTLGQESPEEWLISVADKDTGKVFSNIATDIGVDHNHLSGGVIADDFNNDG